MAKISRKDNATSLRLGEIKAPLQKVAMEMDRSLNWLIISLLKQTPIIQKYYEEKERISKK